MAVGKLGGRVAKGILDRAVNIGGDLAGGAYKSAKVGLKGAEKAGKFANKAFLTDDKAGRQLKNLYTGKKMNALPAIGIAGGALGLGVMMGRAEDDIASGTNIGSASIAHIVSGRPAPGPSDIVESPSMLADAQSLLPSKADDLGTNGSMLFGMHNRKQGGYL